MSERMSSGTSHWATYTSSLNERPGGQITRSNTVTNLLVRFLDAG